MLFRSTLCALRRRGYTPESIFDFLSRVGVAKVYSLVDMGLLEHCIREELNSKAPRRVCVSRPVKLIVDNYPEGQTEYFELPNNPGDPEAGTRKVPFSRELYIEEDDYSLDPPPKFFRLKPDGEVRLMGAYIVKFKNAVKDENGNVLELHCEADLETKNGMPADGRKIKGTIHWLSAKDALDTDIMLYNKLFTLENVADIPEGKTYDDYINPDSVIKIEGAKIEASLKDAKPGERFQFVRLGYFTPDSKHKGTFNRIVELKDSHKA